MSNYSPRYPNDVETIRKALADDGVYVTPQEAENLWDEYSDRYAAGWLGLPDNPSDIPHILSSDVRQILDKRENSEITLKKLEHARSRGMDLDDVISSIKSGNFR